LDHQVLPVLGSAEVDGPEIGTVFPNVFRTFEYVLPHMSRYCCCDRPQKTVPRSGSFQVSQITPFTMELAFISANS
jgi:hypothetical protein